MIAALYVEKGGVYFGLPGVEPWDRERDARLYAGPYPVVAHPPCERWGRFFGGNPAQVPRLKMGDDGGCFAAAVAAVRKYGGVLEHPEATHAWAVHGIVKPPKRGGWVSARDGIGWTCCVEQGHYGHLARKATWLYYVGEVKPPELRWGASTAAGTHKPLQSCSFQQRIDSPIPFRDLLIDLARGARKRPLGPAMALGVLW